MPGLGVGIGVGGNGAGGGGLPTLSFAGGVSQAEGNSGTTPFVFTLNLTRNGFTGPVTVTWSVAGSGASPADANDFVGGVLPTGTVTFAAGDTSKTITVNVAGDTNVEPDENFTLTAIGTIQLAPASSTGTIQNDDVAATSPFDLSANDNSAFLILMAL